MFEYRQVLLHLRGGDSDRDIARAGLMGRQKLALLRGRSSWAGLMVDWIRPTSWPSLRPSSTISSVQPWRELVSQWLDAGVLGKAIHAALVRNHGYRGNYSSVARLIVALRGQRQPETTVWLSYQPGEAVQVTALGNAACMRGHPVLFTGTIDIINMLAAAQASGSIKRVLHHYIKPEVLCIDELGYLLIDKFGADCLFQIISHLYEHGATLLTTNRVYKQLASIFNNDSVKL